MTKSTWRGEGHAGSKPKGDGHVEKVQEIRGKYHIGQSVSVDQLERTFAEVSLTEKYDCKKVVLDINAHQCVEKTSCEDLSPSETSVEGKYGPQEEEVQKKQEEGTGENNKEGDPKENGEVKREISEQEEYVRDVTKNVEERLSLIPVHDEDDNEDDSSDEEDQGPLITVKLEDSVKDNTDALNSSLTPKIPFQDSNTHQPLKEASQRDKSPSQITEVSHGPQKEAEEKENRPWGKEDDLEQGDKVEIHYRQKKDDKCVSKDEEKGFPSVAEDEGVDDEESSDEEDQLPLITVKLEDAVKDDTDEAYLERGPSKGGSVHMRYSPMTPKSHGLGIHGNHGLHPHTSSGTAAGLYPSSHMSRSPRYGISAGPYSNAVTPSAYQSACSPGSLAGLPPLIESTTSSASYANTSPQRESTATLSLGSYANTSPLYEGTPALSPGSYTSACPLYEGTSAVSLGSYASASPLYEGTSAVSPGSYTSASPLYEGTSAVSPGSYTSASPLYEGTSAVSPGSYTSASPLYEGTSAVSPGSYTSASPLYEGTSAVSPGSYTSASPLYEGTSAVSPGSYTSASPLYEGTSAVSPGSYTIASPLYEGIAPVSQGSCADASPLYEGTCAVSPVSYTIASPLYEGTAALSPSFYRSTSPSCEGIGKAGPQTNLFIDGSVAVTPAPAFVQSSGGPLSPPASDTSSLHDYLEAHTDSLGNYTNINNCGGLIGEHGSLFPEMSTPYMTPPHQAVQPSQVYNTFGQHSSIEEVLEVITRVDVGEVESDVGEAEPEDVDQILKDLQSLDGREFAGVEVFTDTNFLGENQPPFSDCPGDNYYSAGKHNKGYKDIKQPKPQPKGLSIPQQEMKRRMSSKTSLEQICREMTLVGIENTAALYRVGSDGETWLTRILKHSSDSENFYENIYALQEILKRIPMCCNVHVDRQYKRCSKCGQTDAEEFFTPLSVCNVEGKCGLIIAVEKNHPPVVVNYLCSGIEECRKDMQRAFNQQARQIFALNITSYPVFGRFLSNLRK